MSKRTYLITGATGTVGSRVVDALLERGVRPRVFVRDPAKALAWGDRAEVAVGAFEDSESVSRALRGVTDALLVTSGPRLDELDAVAARIAKDEGVEHLVKLSSFDAAERVGTGVWHARGEAAIASTGIAFTFVRPTGFMSNALFWAHAIRSGGVLRSTTGDGAIAFIHPRDIADVCVAALLSRAYAGQSLAITGSVARSYAEMAAVIARAAGVAVRFEPTTEAEIAQRMLAAGDSSEMIDAHLGIYRALREGRLSAVTDTVERVLGRAPSTFEAWVAEHRDAFSEDRT